MPNIELRGNGLDGSWILAIMLFPSDERMRRAFYAVQFAESELEEYGTTDSIEVGAGLLCDLVAAPGKAELKRIVSAKTKRACVAGDFLATLFGLWSFRSRFAEPSVRKAIYVAQAFARKSTYGDGSKLPSSETAIRSCVDEFRSVAHLWAAKRLHQTFPIRPHKEMLRSQDAVRDFLSIALNLQEFGCWFIPKRAKQPKPLLDRETLWSVPRTFDPLVPPWKEPPSWLVSTMRSYRAG